MKALIILADNIYLTPYIKFYTSLLDECKCKYDIIYWDKNENESFNKKNYYRFYYKAKGKFNKLLGYFKYRKYIFKIEKKEKYDLIIPLHSIVSFLIAGILLKKYNKRYIYDVRDYSYEKFYMFRYIQNKIVNNSLINIISSRGFEEFLPESKYYVVHNFNNINYQNYKQLSNSNKIPIQLSYIGLIRFVEQNKKILLFFKNDNRFHINLIGTNANMLKDFCENNNIENVTLIDTFDPQLTLNYYKETDLVMNLYGNNTPLLNYALSNKLYYSANLYKPILVCSNTYMEEISKKYNIGHTLNLKSENEKDELYNYIKELNRDEFIKNCNNFIKDVIEEQKKSSKEIINRILELRKGSNIK